MTYAQSIGTGIAIGLIAVSLVEAWLRGWGK